MRQAIIINVNNTLNNYTGKDTNIYIYTRVAIYIHTYTDKYILKISSYKP